MKKGWGDGKGVVGVHIHGLKDANGNQAYKGKNPLADVNVQTRSGVKTLSNVAKTYDPPYASSNRVYDHIKTNIETWIEEAIRVRDGTEDKTPTSRDSFGRPCGVQTPIEICARC